MNSALETATRQAAGGDPAEQQRLIAAWHDAIGVLSRDAKPVLKKGSQGDAILHTPQNDLASRVQTMLAKQATAAGQVQTAQPAQTIAIPTGDSFSPEVRIVKFDNDDIAGWLQMAPELIFKPPKGRLDRPATRAANHTRQRAHRLVRRLGNWTLRSAGHHEVHRGSGPL